MDRTTSTSVFADGRLSTRADPTRGQRAGRIGKRTGHAHDQAPYEFHTCIYPILGLLWEILGEQFPKMGDSLARMPTNHRAKFEIAGFVLGGEIHNRTNKQKNTRTVNDISTPCLSACVDIEPDRL